MPTPAPRKDNAKRGQPDAQPAPGAELDLTDLEILCAADKLQMVADKFSALKAQRDDVLTALLKVDAEVCGCGPNVSLDFLRLALNSVRAIARAAIAKAGAL